MSLQFQKFAALHAGDLFLLPNAWDARSAILFEESGFAAVGTSSAAIANSLGQEDGEHISFQDYLFVIKKIVSAINVPVTIDMEMGYGKTDDAIADNMCQLADLGVAGINIEDSFFIDGVRKMKDAELFARTVNHIRTKLQAKKLDLFINVRCDTYILNVRDALTETLRRLKIYNAIGADGIFIPCMAAENDIVDAVANSMLPINLMCVPELPGMDTLSKLGVRRVSMGPFAFQKIYKGIGELSKAVLSGQTFTPLFH